MKRTTLAIFVTLLTMASTSFAATQAAGVATVAPTLNVSATIQKAVSLTLSTGATGGISHCTVVAGGGAPDYTMNFGTVDALGINAGNCNKFNPATPGVNDAIYWTDYQVTPVYTSHTAFAATTVCSAAAIVKNASAAVPATCNFVTLTSASARSLVAFAAFTEARRRPKSIGSQETRVPTAEPQTLWPELVPSTGPVIDGITDCGNSCPNTLLCVARFTWPRKSALGR